LDVRCCKGVNAKSGRHDLDRRRERSEGEAVSRLPHDAPESTWDAGEDVRNQRETMTRCFGRSDRFVKRLRHKRNG
jgi:hypothetical protein